MSEITLYIPSYNDSELVRQSLASAPEWNVVISDNGSAEPHRQALADMACDRVQVIRHERSLGRVGNWKFCVQHFVDSGSTWLKLLCAGDVHRPHSLAVYQRAMTYFPEARFILGNIVNHLPEGPVTWLQIDDDYSLLQPAEAMRQAAQNGNVFYGLLAPLIHVDLLRDGFNFGEETLSFSADMLFLMNIGKKSPTLYTKEFVADFIIANRKQALSKNATLEHFLEEGLLRLRAAECYRELTGDRPECQQLLAKVAQWVRQGLDNPPQVLLRDA